jgi:sulfatase modifying factor 1
VMAVAGQGPLLAQGARSAFRGRQAGEERQVYGVTLCWCPEGRFVMGSPPSEADRRSGEDQVEVTLTRGFWMAKYEATQSQWKRITGALPGPLTAELPAGDDLPVGNVNFAEVDSFCRRLTELARESGGVPKNWEFRLPTEAQWEYACRAGTTTATSFGEALSSNQANFKGKSYNGAEQGPSLGRAAKVGSYPANAWGLHDMHGNAFEWCRDWYHSRLPGGADPDLYYAKSTRKTEPAIGPAYGGAAAGPTRAGPAGRRFVCGSSPNGDTTTSVFVSPLWNCDASAGAPPA